MGRRSRKRGESTRAERDAARRERAARARRRRAAPRGRPTGAVGQLPAVRARRSCSASSSSSGAPLSGSGGGRCVAAGLVIASLGGGELALREHLAGYRSHSRLLAGVAAFVAVTVVALGARAGAGLDPVVVGARRVRGYLLRDAGDVQAPLGRARVPVSEQRMRITRHPPHHAPRFQDLERSFGLLPEPARHAAGEADRQRGRQSARHFVFGDAEGVQARSITCLEYPDLDEGRSGVAQPITSLFRSRASKSLQPGSSTCRRRGFRRPR